MEARRKRDWQGSWPISFTFWYWLLSGYGERVVRAFLVLSAMIIGFAVLYVLIGFIKVDLCSLSGVLQAFWEPILYSLGAITRQNDTLAGSASLALRSLVILEGIFGPLQIGLIALALRRQFMRQ
jgi:hypothetical protein